MYDEYSDEMQTLFEIAVKFKILECMPTSVYIISNNYHIKGSPFHLLIILTARMNIYAHYTDLFAAIFYHTYKP